MTKSPGRDTQHWEYLTRYISGALGFPDTVGRDETLNWASKSISQQLNDVAARGWEVIDLRWLSDIDLMVTFKRPADAPSQRGD